MTKGSFADERNGKINQLEAFVRRVESLRGTAIPEHEADEIIVYAREIINEIRTEMELMADSKTDFPESTDYEKAR